MNDKPPLRRRQRRLSDAERALWGEVTRGIKQFRPPSTGAPDTPIDPEATQAAPVAEKAPAQRPVRVATPEAKQPPPLAPLGRRMRQRIARGGHAIGGRLDLHGLTQREAHDKLLRFLRDAQDHGETLVLVITGKGVATGERTGERGVLRRQVPQWLGLPAFRSLIVGFEPAHIAHGGEGALYVRLRRKRARD